MGNSPNPSLLEYARFHGIASDFTAVDPLTYVDDTCKIPTPEIQPGPVLERLQTAQRAIAHTLLKEKLDIKKEGARLLSTVIRDAGSKTDDINWADVLPAFDGAERLQVENLIFPKDYDTNTMLARRSSGYDDRDIQLELLEEPPSVTTLSSRLTDIENEAISNIKSEKLSCSKDTFMLVQHAMDCADPSKKIVEDLLTDELRSCQSDLVFPEPSPLVLSHIDDTYFRSPSPVTVLQVLPSPTSSDLLAEHKSQPNSFLRSQKHGQNETTHVGTVSHFFGSYDREISSEFEPENGLDRTSGFSSTRESISSGQDSVNKNQNSTINMHVVPDASTHTGSPLPCFSKSTLNNPPKNNFNEIRIDAVISSTKTPTPSPTKDPFTADEVICSNTTEGLFSEEIGDNTVSLEGNGHFSCPKNESNISPDILPAISPLQPLCQFQDLEKNTKRSSPTNMAQKPPQEKHLRLKYKDPSSHGSLLPQKRERSKSRESLQLKSNQIQQRKKSQREMRDPTAILPLQISLGSLSSFMKIRGQVRSRRPIVATSQYFAKSQPVNEFKEYDPAMNTEGNTMLAPATLIDKVPHIQRKTYRQSYLYISTALLKTHLHVIQSIEKTRNAPTIEYREYGTSVRHFPSKYTSGNIPLQPDTRPTLPNEADIIISPTTGVILTTSQAITQLYLPGHKPKNAKITNLKSINSPLREQIFLLAPRYEHLYLLISHGTISRQGSQGGKTGPTWTADKRTLASFASLLAFCNSISDCATIVPLWVPSSPQTLARWVLSLHDKHAVELPRSYITPPRQKGFTPVNPKPQSQLTRAEQSSMEETNWEHFLRRAGLNPHAAQAVLIILNKEGMKAEGESSSHKPGNFGSLSQFMSMSSERRQELFGELIGEKVIHRLSQVIEKDWQCDWALNFNDSAKL